MFEMFANSLVSGFFKSNVTGQIIVLAQLLGSVVMLAIILGKWKALSGTEHVMKRVSRDVMTGHDVLEYYLQRHPSYLVVERFGKTAGSVCPRHTLGMYAMLRAHNPPTSVKKIDRQSVKIRGSPPAFLITLVVVAGAFLPADRAAALASLNWAQMHMYLLLVEDFSKTHYRNRYNFLFFYMYHLEIYDVF